MNGHRLALANRAPRKLSAEFSLSRELYSNMKIKSFLYRASLDRHRALSETDCISE
jgi:hypothetical protein